MIGHSFGGVCAAFALNEGADAKKLVTIGSPASMDYILTMFMKQLGVSAPTLTILKARLEELGQRPIVQFSLAHLIDQINIPGLIVHDHQDREVIHEQALILREHWPKAEQISTSGLGHHRILRDANVIAAICEFIMIGQTQQTRIETPLKLRTIESFLMEGQSSKV
ncbi:lipase family protein [Chloroflexi bacterium TSY]|nr:lipase family protein [Chloroflexi bacterium TSY]